MEKIHQGAEAVIYKEGNNVIKERKPKSYRIKDIDKIIRKSRTKKEIKIIKKANEIINTPKLIEENIKDCKIIMEYIEGEKLSDCLEKFNKEKQIRLMREIGKNVAKLHKNDIIHNDLTTSNMILKNGEVYFIDFGLSFISKKEEDKAVDIHLFRQALEAKHWKNWKLLFETFLDEYKKNYEKAEKILERFKKVEKRGRYKSAI